MSKIIQMLGKSLATDPTNEQIESMSKSSKGSISNLDKTIINFCERFL